VQHGTHGVGEYPNRASSDSVRFWAVSYQRVELNSFLFVDLPRQDFAHPVLIFILCGSFEYLEGFWCARLESQWARLYRPTVIVENDVLIFLSTSRFRGHFPRDADVHDFAHPCAGSVPISLQHMQRKHQDRDLLR